MIYLLLISCLITTATIFPSMQNTIKGKIKLLSPYRQSVTLPSNMTEDAKKAFNRLSYQKSDGIMYYECASVKDDFARALRSQGNCQEDIELVINTMEQDCLTLTEGCKHFRLTLRVAHDTDKFGAQPHIDAFNYDQHGQPVDPIDPVYTHRLFKNYRGVGTWYAQNHTPEQQARFIQVSYQKKDNQVADYPYISWQQLEQGQVLVGRFGDQYSPIHRAPEISRWNWPSEKVRILALYDIKF